MQKCFDLESPVILGAIFAQNLMYLIPATKPREFVPGGRTDWLVYRYGVFPFAASVRWPRRHHKENRFVVENLLGAELKAVRRLQIPQ